MTDLATLKRKAEAAREECARRRGQLEALERQREAKEAERAERERQAALLDRVAQVFRAASELARERARARVEASVTDALRAVFGPGILFRVEVGDRGGRPAAEFLVSSTYGGGEVTTPVLDARGGGVVDVASVALRVLAAAVASPPGAPIVLDEPGKHLSEGYSRAFGELLKAVAEETGRQVIVITHDPRLAETADRVYHVEQRGGVSVAVSLPRGD